MTLPALLQLTVPTPGGSVTALVTPEDDVVRAAGFATGSDLAARLSPALRARGTQRVGPVGGVAEALLRYSDGELAALDAVPVDQPGGPFLQQAWKALRAVPPGSTISYAGLARSAGRPAAIRAAGSACARNLLAPFVPCHRVVRSDRTLGGYYYGVAVKQALLRHEAEAAPGDGAASAADQ